MAKLLLFDLDGTLVTTGGAGLRALDRIFEELHGVHHAMKGVSPAGKTDPRIVREIFQKKLGREPSAEELKRACDGYLRYLAEEIVDSPGYRAMEGIHQLLKDLHVDDRFVLGLGTGNLEKGARIKLEPAQLNAYFSFGGFGSDAEVRSEVLRTAVHRAEERTGIRFAPRDVYVIGDTILDVEAGKAIGAVTVAVGCGHGKEMELCAAGADLFLPTFAEPSRLLKLL